MKRYLNRAATLVVAFALIAAGASSASASDPTPAGPLAIAPTSGTTADTAWLLTAPDAQPTACNGSAFLVHNNSLFIARADSATVAGGLIARANVNNAGPLPRTYTWATAPFTSANTYDKTALDAIKAGTAQGDFVFGFGCVGVATGDATANTLDGSRPYYASVIHFDGEGNWSVVGGEPDPEPTAPSVPTNVIVTPGQASLTVSWNAVTATPAVTGYQIAVTAGGTPVTGSPFSAGAGDTSAVISGLTGGTEYSVTVTAINSVGSSAPSAPVTGTPTAAPETVDTGDIAATVTVPTAATEALSLQVPSSGVAALGTAVEKPNGDFEANGDLGTIGVTDTRAEATQTPWTVQATVRDFALDSNPDVKIGAAQLGSAVTVTGTGVTKGADQAAGSAAAVRVLAQGVKGATSGSIETDLNLLVPKGTTDGAYTSTITIDLIKS